MMKLSPLEMQHYLMIMERYDKSVSRLYKATTGWFVSPMEKMLAVQEHDAALQSLFCFVMDMKGQGQ